jgi:hypothetical protein
MGSGKRALFVLVVTSSWIVGGCTDLDKGSTDGAQISCEDAVKDHFNDDADAEIVKITPQSYESPWKFSGSVEADGLTGTRRQTTFSCTVTDTGDTYSVQWQVD